MRVRADAATRAAAELQLAWRPAAGGPAVASATLSDLAHADELTPVFDLAQLRALPGGDYLIDCRLVEKGGGKLLGEFRQKLTKPDPAPPAAFLRRARPLQLRRRGARCGARAFPLRGGVRVLARGELHAVVGNGPAGDVLPGHGDLGRRRTGLQRGDAGPRMPLLERRID
ncbi:MAG: hypothetical protein WDM96_05000 [Lacunisphaera sp.]